MRFQQRKIHVKRDTSSQRVLVQCKHPIRPQIRFKIPTEKGEPEWHVETLLKSKSLPKVSKQINSV